MNRYTFDRKLQRLFVLLEPVLTPMQLDEITGFWGQAEADLAVDLAVRLVAERGAPISAELHDLLVELLAASDWANAHDDDLAVLARLRT
ncbi:MAG TPA: hypothetical protein VHN14_36790 [Kofleriaceae bacterium]|jgi:hypothetical protein|nr:hypothetical protein [Kofleriaceae bacterium]